ncbi:MAG: response regulator transcription factor [Lachnospiraceae bacterium]|nr:response regulator transcription factor [Lachnospiraceae bacterium]
MDRHRILIIDDDMEVLSLMKTQLEVLYEVEIFSSGEEALGYLTKTCREDRPDSQKKLPQLIFLDIAMKGMDGYEVLERLKSEDMFKSIPVAFLTGMTDEVAECKGLLMDVVDYLKKPVAGKVLLARVQHYLELYSDTEGKGKLDETKLLKLSDPLTEREMDVARLMAEFRSDREISDILYISMPYTKKIVASVKDKLGLEKRGDIRRYLL